MTLLVARDVWVAPPAAGSPPVVRGLSLAVDRGEWVALTGPNGCGKTSLVLAVAGLWPIRRGTIEFDGRPLDAHSRGAPRADVGVVLQEPAAQLLQPSVAEELAFTARNLGRPAGEVARLVERWSEMLCLTQDLGRDPLALSAGRQQVTLLAAALVARPRLLVLDEVGAHLDRESRALVLEAVRSEVRQGLAVIWVTQEPEERAAADRTIALGDPQVLLEPGSGALDRVRGIGPALERPDPPCPSCLLARLAVSAWEGGEGPHVEAKSSLVIEVAERGVTSLLGRNGSGKSVLLSAVAGLVRVSQVEVTWLRRPERTPILAAQYPELQLFEERVEDEVCYAAVRRGLPRGEARARATECFEALGLGGLEFLGRRSWDLSAGEKRLTQVVAALIAPASLVLLDEPTCGLDPRCRGTLAGFVIRRAEADGVMVASQDTPWVQAVGGPQVRVGDE